jgi:hypothetical protein
MGSEGWSGQSQTRRVVYNVIKFCEAKKKGGISVLRRKTFWYLNHNAHNLRMCSSCHTIRTVPVSFALAVRTFYPAPIIPYQLEVLTDCTSPTAINLVLVLDTRLSYNFILFSVALKSCQIEAQELCNNLQAVIIFTLRVLSLTWTLDLEGCLRLSVQHALSYCLYLESVTLTHNFGAHSALVTHWYSNKMQWSPSGGVEFCYSTLRWASYTHSTLLHLVSF